MIIDVQTQLNAKQPIGSYLLTSGGNVSGNISSTAYFNWTNQYGLSWTNEGQLTCSLMGDVYFNLYGKKYYFQQTGTTNPIYPLHINTYIASTQTYEFLNYSGLGGPGTYSQTIAYTVHTPYVQLSSMLFQMHELTKI